MKKKGSFLERPKNKRLKTKEKKSKVNKKEKIWRRKFGSKNNCPRSFIPEVNLPLKPHTWLGPILNLGGLVIGLNSSMVGYTCLGFKLLCLVNISFTTKINTQYRRLVQELFGAKCYQERQTILVQTSSRHRFQAKCVFDKCHLEKCRKGKGLWAKSF